MISLFDITGESVDDVGNSYQIGFMSDVAQKHGLKFLNSMFEIGYTVDIKQVMDELDRVQWPEDDGILDIVTRFVASLAKCKGGLAYLSM